ncbi:unnamed protein product [Zymoseptoria tritici ST99CH_3D1]|uniref:Uncharacterized protein n=1 Tax=Zymoseptoria tritici ST99CH_1E4 TaxID=1276532 RepID=A0A2H1GBH4_ZYMTR|nr:unnamed protein product [Zymoseptoria tritici ST99CH_1E4]SMR51841.1 unnamed protein product [Zymoseptoria tritici ST99CH_3D1]
MVEYLEEYPDEARDHPLGEKSGVGADEQKYWSDDRLILDQQAMDFLRAHVLRRGHVILCTANNSASKEIRQNFASRNKKAKVYVEVDEAFTVTEASLLIVFTKGNWVGRIVMISLSTATSNN